MLIGIISEFDSKIVFHRIFDKIYFIIRVTVGIVGYGERDLSVVFVDETKQWIKRKKIISIHCPLPRKTSRESG